MHFESNESVIEWYFGGKAVVLPRYCHVDDNNDSKIMIIIGIKRKCELE